MARGRRKMDCFDTSSSSIPEELVYNILLCLPANVLFDVMRFVCRMWYNIIHDPRFIASHLKTSTSTAADGGSLIIHRHLSGYLAKMRNFDIAVQNLKFRFRGPVIGSCNGLVLFLDEKMPSCLWVANPVTKQQLKLPPTRGIAESCGFGYANSSREYKVVNRIVQIFTLGVDNDWRTPNPIDFGYYFTFVKSLPLSVGGFVYWAADERPFILGLDLETELFQEIRLPPGCENKSLKLLAMGSCLSFMWSRAIDLWEVWLLIDPKTGKLEKLSDVNFQGKTYVLNDMPPTPVGWLRNGEILVFHTSFPSDVLLVYNVKTGRIHSTFDLDSSKFGYQKIYGAHVNTLIRLPKETTWA